MALRYENDNLYDIARKNIKAKRKELGLTQQKLAELADMSLDYLAEIENEKRKKSFSLAMLGRIADALGVEAYTLLLPNKEK